MRVSSPNAAAGRRCSVAASPAGAAIATVAVAVAATAATSQH
jgi:hypothetical protein